MTPDLKPLSIGPIRVHLPVVLAPMAGYTDLPFRLLCRRMGAAYCTTEMMLDKMLFVRGPLPGRMTALSDDDHPVAGQIIGNEPDVMAAAAAELCTRGFDVVDLNFACPVRKALSRRRGGYLMKEPARAARIVQAVVAEADRPVTLKLRQRFAESGDDGAFWRIAEAAFDAGAAAVCVHARSVQAMYRGPADWEFIAAVKRRYPDRTIIGSGDVKTPQVALDMLRQTGADGVSVARAALGNPWFFRDVADLAAGRGPRHPSLAEQRQVMEDHFVGACELHGPDRGPKIMRKHGIRYARLHARPKAMRVAFVAVKTAAHWRRVLEEYYTPD
ncbi:MAG TPA: tRNA-dihydrouridine synthase [Phycisphaerae bacterium]|nr:tRNA-dihydrouridine synthase [Phycisphaerae bacterium]HUT59935.1 tRNA-dihydrouridine synthase [Phycisphaerae bacterium]